MSHLRSRLHLCLDKDTPAPCLGQPSWPSPGAPGAPALGGLHPHLPSLRGLALHDVTVESRMVPTAQCLPGQGDKEDGAGGGEVAPHKAPNPTQHPKPPCSPPTHGPAERESSETNVLLCNWVTRNRGVGLTQSHFPGGRGCHPLHGRKGAWGTQIPSHWLRSGLDNLRWQVPLQV